MCFPALRETELPSTSLSPPLLASFISIIVPSRILILHDTPYYERPIAKLDELGTRLKFEAPLDLPLEIHNFLTTD